MKEFSNVRSRADSGYGQTELQFRFSRRFTAQRGTRDSVLNPEQHPKRAIEPSVEQSALVFFCHSLDLRTAKRLGVHTVGGTWLARIRAVLAVGHARISQLTGQQRKQRLTLLALSQWGNPFLSFSYLRSRMECPYFFLGELFLFFALSFLSLSSSRIRDHEPTSRST